MCSLSTAAFCKQKACPSTETLLSYQAGVGLTSKERESVMAHLTMCDFCGAELQLLVKHPPCDEPWTAAEMPLHLRLLANSILVV